MNRLDLHKLHALIQQVGRCSFSGRLWCVDPGETTGTAIFEHSKDQTTLINAQQVKTWPIEDAVSSLTQQLRDYTPNLVVFESYHIYDWKLAQHSFADVPTLQIIGVMKTLCIQRNVPFVAQSAQTGKGFVTDDRLKLWSLHIPGQVHSRDAVRHGCQYLIFDKKS